jgi:hypothetical protein
MGKSAFARGPRDLRSVTLQERLRAKWRDEIRRRPPAEREKWLKTQEAIVALSARVCRELIRAIRDQHDYVAGKVCSKPWIDAWDRKSSRRRHVIVSISAGGATRREWFSRRARRGSGHTGRSAGASRRPRL